MSEAMPTAHASHHANIYKFGCMRKAVRYERICKIKENSSI